MKRNLLIVVAGIVLVVVGVLSGSALVSILGAVVAAAGAAGFWPDPIDGVDTRWRF